jgi:hypothetical protein
MSIDPDKDSDVISLAQLSAQLKLLAGVEPPKSLRDRLVAAVSPKGAREVGPRAVRCWSKTASWAGVAAAAVVALVAVLWLLPPTRRSLSSTPDINDRSTAAVMADANIPRPRDSNTYDINAL